MAFGPCDDPNLFLQSYGYSEIRPPSQLLAPGALVTVIRKHPFFEAKLICSAEASLGRDVRYMRSATASGGLKWMAGRSFKLDASAIGQLKERDHFRAVDTIEVTLNKARIVELTDDDVLRGMQHRSAACREAVRARVERGYTVTMISSALVGDLTYTVSWDYSRGHTTDMSDKSLAMMDLSIMLDGEVKSTASGEIHATGLVWGIRDDEYLSALSLPYVPTSDFQRNTRHIPVDHIATLDKGSGSDAVVVRPAKSGS